MRCQVDLAHPAGAEHPQDRVTGKRLTCLKGHGAIVSLAFAVLGHLKILSAKSRLRPARRRGRERRRRNPEKWRRARMVGGRLLCGQAECDRRDGGRQQRTRDRPLQEADGVHACFLLRCNPMGSVATTDADRLRHTACQIFAKFLRISCVSRLPRARGGGTSRRAWGLRTTTACAVYPHARRQIWLSAQRIVKGCKASPGK